MRLSVFHSHFFLPPSHSLTIACSRTCVKRNDPGVSPMLRRSAYMATNTPQLEESPWANGRHTLSELDFALQSLSCRVFSCCRQLAGEKKGSNKLDGGRSGWAKGGWGWGWDWGRLADVSRRCVKDCLRGRKFALCRGHTRRGGSRERHLSAQRIPDDLALPAPRCLLLTVALEAVQEKFSDFSALKISRKRHQNITGHQSLLHG